FESTSVTKDILESPFRNRLTVTFDQNESLPVVYSSSDDKVAKIDESGTVTFLKAGSVTITATVEETETYQGATASYKLTVTTPKPEMVFEATSVQMDIRENSFHNPLTVKLYNQVNTELPVVYSSSNTGIATVGADGTVSFIKFGTVKITATINPTDLYQKASVSYDLNITAPTPVLTFEQPAIRVIGISETVTNPLSVMLEENPFTEGVVTYKSSNMSVATVDTNTGVVTPKGVGNVTITARMAEGTYYHASETTYQLFVDKSPSSLPFVFDGKSADITNMMGLTAESLGSDYAASPCLKFSSNTSSVLLSFDEVPGKLYFKVKQYSTLRGYFVVEQSADGQEFEVVAEYTSISETGETKLIENLKNSSRYIRWRFINRTGGNIALGGIELKKFSILKNPVFETEEETFFYSHEVRLSCATAEAKIYYTLTGEDPDSNSLLYTGPFTIEETTQIKAAAFLNDEKSDIISKTYTRLITSVKADKEGLVFPVLNLWEVPEKKSLSFTLKTEHLQSDLSVQVEGDGFSVDKSVLSKADANGAEINVTYLPLRHGTYSGSVIIKGDGLDEPTVVTLLGETKIVADELLLDEDFEFMKDLSDNNSFKIEGWTFASCYVDRANQRMRVGSSGSLGSVTLPQFDFSKEEYTYTLSFDSQIFNIADHKEMKVTIHGRDEIIKLSDGNKNYRFDIPVATGSTGSIRISGVQIINNRFYLDNIRIIKKLKKLAYTVPATTSYEDLNARLRLDGLTSVTFNQPVSFIDQGSIIAPANPNCLFYTPTDLGFGQNQVLEGNCANLSLSDNHPFDIVRPFSATAASYVRKAYQDGLWETIVLPYDVAESAMPQEYEFAKYDGLTADKSGVVFTEVKSLTAHTPYLMRYSGSNKTNGTALCHFEAVDVAIGEQIESAGFVGVYARTATEGKWLLNVKNGVSVFQKGLPESAINPFRAYLDLVLTESAGMRIVHRPADATSLDAVTSIGEWQLRSGSQGELIVTTREAMTIRIVAIDGRVLRVVSVDAGENRISGLPAGICIVNGKKGVVR
ncbi:MAG: Ig-like domain-containing protein, partial [Bacteroidales bacterium]